MRTPSKTATARAQARRINDKSRDEENRPAERRSAWDFKVANYGNRRSQLRVVGGQVQCRGQKRTRRTARLYHKTQQPANPHGVSAGEPRLRSVFVTLTIAPCAQRMQYIAALFMGEA